MLNMKKREIAILACIICISLIGLFFLQRNNSHNHNDVIEPTSEATEEPTNSPDSSNEPSPSFPTTMPLPSGEAEGEWIAVVHRSRVIHWFDSGVDDIHTVEGLVGKMEIEVKDNSWRISYVDCPNHTCEKMGWRSLDSIEIPITCIPNDIIIVPKSMADNMDLIE